MNVITVSGKGVLIKNATRKWGFLSPSLKIECQSAGRVPVWLCWIMPRVCQSVHQNGTAPLSLLMGDGILILVLSGVYHCQWECFVLWMRLKRHIMVLMCSFRLLRRLNLSTCLLTISLVSCHCNKYLSESTYAEKRFIWARGVGGGLIAFRSLMDGRWGRENHSCPGWNQRMGGEGGQGSISPRADLVSWKTPLSQGGLSL